MAHWYKNVVIFSKKQYEEYIARTYPEWNELMYGKPQSQMDKTDIYQNRSQTYTQQEPEMNSSLSIHQKQVDIP